MDSPATPGFRQIVGRETELEHLEGAWDEELGRELAQLLPSLGHAGGDGAIADERYRAHRAVSRLLAILADAQPLVLILDDLHWSDGASIELIAALVRRRPAAPVLLALGFRPGQAADRLSAAVAVPGVDRIELGGLTEEEAAQLLDGVDSGSVAAIYRHGGGNPFYLEQLGRTHDSTFLRAVETGAGGGVPSAVAGAIAGELEPLPPSARTLLDAAAVAGEPFEPDFAAVIADLGEGDGLTALDDLLELDLVRPTQVPRRFMFRHPLVPRRSTSRCGAAGGLPPTLGRRRPWPYGARRRPSGLTTWSSRRDIPQQEDDRVTRAQPVRETRCLVARRGGSDHRARAARERDVSLGEQISDWREHVADGFRGRPDVDLADYAATRGLDHRGQMAQTGYVAAFPMTSDLQFNVLRGTLPGGDEGVLFHEVKLHEADLTSGTFYGHKVGGDVKAKDLLSVIPMVGETYRYFKAPYTVAAIRLPQASGPIVGLDIGRGGERVMHADPPGTGGGIKAGFTLNLSRRKDEPISTGPQAWAGYTLDHFAMPGWRAAWRGRARREVVEEVLQGPVAQLLSTERPLGFRVEFAYGTLLVTQQHFLKHPAELDYHAQTASWLAGAIRAICMARAAPQAFGFQLPPPGWAAKIEENPGDTFIGLDGQDLGRAAAVGRDRGLATEDPFEFHRAFPDLPVPGEAIGVFRGILPGTSLTGRLVTAIERPLRPPPPDWDRVLAELPHGTFGCDSVLFRVRAGTPDAHSDVGAVWADGSRYAIRRGIFVGWRARNSPHTDGAELDRLTADAVRFAGEQGLLA